MRCKNINPSLEKVLWISEIIPANPKVKASVISISTINFSTDKNTFVATLKKFMLCPPEAIYFVKIIDWTHTNYNINLK